MKRNRILSSIATIAIISAAPAFAKPGGGGAGMGGGAANAGAGPMGGISETGSTMRDMGRANSQGPANASPNALDRVNSNSVLSTTTDDAGSTTRIRGQDRIRDNATDLDDDDDDGTETNVSDRALEARTNSQGPANANVNGLVNANPNSVLSGAGVTTLTGLTTGLTVNNSAGTSIGTVTEVLTNRSGGVVGIRVDLTGDGGIVFIPATTLSMDGTIVTTSSTNF